MIKWKIYKDLLINTSYILSDKIMYTYFFNFLKSTNIAMILHYHIRKLSERLSILFHRFIT